MSETFPTPICQAILHFQPLEAALSEMKAPSHNYFEKNNKMSSFDEFTVSEKRSGSRSSDFLFTCRLHLRHVALTVYPSCKIRR